MNRIIILSLGMALLALLIPSQVHSQVTATRNNVTSTTLAGQNVSSPSNSSGVSPVTTSTNTTTPHGHAGSLSPASALFLSIASILVLNVCC